MVVLLKKVIDLAPSLFLAGHAVGSYLREGEELPKHVFRKWEM